MTSHLQKKLQAGKLPPLIPKTHDRGRQLTYTPLDYHDFFDEKRVVEFDCEKYNIYFKGNAESTLRILLIHGAGYTGLTWACFVQSLSSLISDTQYIAPDLRAHGETISSDDLKLDADTFVCDLAKLCDNLFPTDVKLLIVGHSMGGALAARLAHRLTKDKSHNVVGAIVIDVVEGTAMAALSYMRHILDQRPTSFASVEEAVKFCYRTGMTKNLVAARISMPSQIRETSNDEKETLAKKSTDFTFAEEGEETVAPLANYTWRTNLFLTEPYWRSWFEGLSKIFLDSAPQKLLILAGVDRLDTELMVASMQGKFQMKVVGKVGHAVHEDSPEEVAEVIAHFCARHRLCPTALQIPDLPGGFPGLPRA